MKFKFGRALAIWVVCSVGLWMFGNRSAYAAANSLTAPAAAESALNKALSSGNRKAVAQLLDPNFQWVDEYGKLRTKAQTLDDLSALAAVTKDERAGILAYNYGQVARFAGRNQKEWFVHVWVKRPQGWRAFSFLDTPIPADGYHLHPVPPRPKDKTCINPCRVLPYKPTNAAVRGAVDAWLATKIDEWHAVVTDWPKHVSNTMVIISPTMRYDKAGRLGLLERQHKAYGTGRHSAAVISMKGYDFGNTVVLRFLHAAPNPGRPRARALRLFVNENGVWRIALSDQTNIVPGAK